jgi:hypothetical protein
MSTVVTRQYTHAVRAPRQHRGKQQYRPEQPIIPAELHLSEFRPQALDVSGLDLARVKVVHYACGLGTTVHLFGTILVDAQPMRCSLHLGDAAHRFKAKSVEAWIQLTGLIEIGRSPWKTSRQTGDTYEAI